MKIRAYEIKEFDLPLHEGYRIAGQTINFVRNVLVRVGSDSGLTGYGSAAPANNEGGESDESCLAALDGPLRGVALDAEISPDPSLRCDAAMRAAPLAPAARAALDMALWDLAARAADLPLVRFWGGEVAPLPTSVTIGVCGVEETLAQARSWTEQGFFVLKIKIGEDVALDVERLQKLRDQVGSQVVMRVDGNQGYNLDEARRLLADTQNLNLEMLEQPVAAGDLDALATLRRESQVPIVADEAAGTVEESAVIVDRKAAHGINIKLMKCGGPSAARTIHDYAHAAGLSLMLGCNDETRISIAAAAHLSVALPGVIYADLDGHMDLVGDPSSAGFEALDGCLHLLERPGLGVDVDF